MKPSTNNLNPLPWSLRAAWAAFSLLAPFHDAGAQCQDGAEYRIFPGDILQISAFRKQVAIQEYRIQVFDKLNIVFPTDPQFSSQQTVTPDGKVHLPRGVEVSVAGLPMDQAKDSVSKQFAAQGWTPEFYLMFSDFGASNADLVDFFADNGNKGRPVAVGPDGYLYLPFLSELAVAGQSIPDANAALNREYANLFPQLDFYIDMKKPDGHRAFIFGDVRQAGGYDVSQNLTALNLLTLAGGALPGADLSRVILLTPEKGTMKGRRLDLKAILKGKGDKADALLCPGTIVYVPKGGLVSVAEFMKTLADVIFFRGFIAGFNWDVSQMFGN